MNLKYFTILGFIVLVFSSACTEQSKNDAVKNLAKMSEAKFPDKEEATREINQVATDYIATLNNDSLGIEARYPLLSQKFIGKYQALISHALKASKSVVMQMTLSDQLQIFGLRNLTTADSLASMSVQEVLTKMNEESIFFGMSDAKLENLLFYSKDEAVGGIRSAFTVSPVAFHRENGAWKIDPFGDPLHQKMKEQKLAQMQGKSYEEYKTYMHEIMETNEESWVPLNDR